MVGTHLWVTFVSSIIMVSSIDEYLSLVRVKGQLWNGKEFTLFERDDTRSLVTWLYICYYRESVRIGGHLKGRCRHPSIYRRVPKTIHHSLGTEFNFQVGLRTNQNNAKWMIVIRTKYHCILDLCCDSFQFFGFFKYNPCEYYLYLWSSIKSSVSQSLTLTGGVH